MESGGGQGATEAIRRPQACWTPGSSCALFPRQPWRGDPSSGAWSSGLQPLASRPWICGPGSLTFAGVGPAGSTKGTPLKSLKRQAVQPGLGLGPQSWLACGLLPLLAVRASVSPSAGVVTPALRATLSRGWAPWGRGLAVCSLRHGGCSEAQAWPAHVPLLPTASRLPSCGGCSFFQFLSFLVFGSSSAPVVLVPKSKPQWDSSLRLQAGGTVMRAGPAPAAGALPARAGGARAPVLSWGLAGAFLVSACSM